MIPLTGQVTETLCNISVELNPKLTFYTLLVKSPG
jgi:hypothetical protein